MGQISIFDQNFFKVVCNSLDSHNYLASITKWNLWIQTESMDYTSKIILGQAYSEWHVSKNLKGSFSTIICCSIQ